MPSGAKAVLTLLLVFLFLSQPLSCIAAAWTLKKGEKLYVRSLHHYRAHSRFDALGVGVPYDRFSYQGMTSLFEYGLAPRVTIGGNVALFEAQQRGVRTNKFARYDKTESVDLFIRRQLMRYRNTVVSVQPRVFLPTLRNHRWQTQSAGAEMRVLMGRSKRRRNTAVTVLPDVVESFSNIELGYKKTRDHADNHGSDHYSFDTTYGIHIPQWRLRLMSQLFSKVSTTRLQVIEQAYVKTQLSASVAVNDRVSLQLGSYHETFGIRSPKGKGLVFGVGYHF